MKYIFNTLSAYEQNHNDDNSAILHIGKKCTFK